ncbi:MAG: hypothetical protein ACFFA5_00535 [Promethearchaeota archaeon]
MTNEAKLNEFSNQIPLPRIEKPAIRIVLGIKLDVLDNYVASIAAILSPEEFGIPDVPLEESKYKPIDLPPFALKRLRMQYLSGRHLAQVGLRSR